MKIGLIAPPWLPVPPVGYGGTEAVVDNVARGLTELGHDVRLFTVGTSTCPVAREHLFAEPPDVMGFGTSEAAHVLAAYDALDDVDVIHDHTSLGPLVAARRGRGHPPVVVTQHNPFTPESCRILSSAGDAVSVVAISDSHARSARGVPIAAVIHHGVDLDRYRPTAGAEDVDRGDGGYLLFLGRMSADKGAHHAVRVARATGRRIVVASRMKEDEEVAYYHREVAPLLRPDDDFPQETSIEDTVGLLSGAAALLNPITWSEPFGLVMVQAMATGTPVLSFPNGSAPEIVEHGVTGFLCDDEDAMTRRVADVPLIDRAVCRAAAERRFSLARMARDHERLYERVVHDAPGNRSASLARL